ncbi:MAG TPA: zinc permease, partial [Bacteroidia bacterium]|nr:zinc permease [Bacteroidia bacterium]
MTAFIILFLLITGGGLLYFLLNKSNDSLLKLSLAFSGAYLFGITITHLVPEVFSQGDKSIGIYVMTGFLFQIILEYFSKGIEHGHIHL